MNQMGYAIAAAKMTDAELAAMIAEVNDRLYLLIEREDERGVIEREDYTERCVALLAESDRRAK
jgi:hypothetical protein